jgi:hypothetical protein
VAGHPLGQRRPPHYWPRGWTNHPSRLWPQKVKKTKQKKKLRVWGGSSDRPYGVVETPLGVVRSPLKGLEKKKSLGFGGGRITPKGLGATPKSAVWGGRNHPQALGGGRTTSKRPRNQKQKKKFRFWVAGLPPDRVDGVAGVAQGLSFFFLFLYF